MSELAGGGSYCHTLRGAAAQAFRNRHGWSKLVVKGLMDVRIDRRRELSSHPPGCCHACVELCGNWCETFRMVQSLEVNACFEVQFCASMLRYEENLCLFVCLFAETCCGTKKICVCLFAETRCGPKKICVCLFAEKCYGTKKICVCLFHVCHGAELSDSTLACIILAQLQVYLPLTNEKLMTFVSRLVGREGIIFTPSGVLFSKVPTEGSVETCPTIWSKCVQPPEKLMWLEHGWEKLRTDFSDMSLSLGGCQQFGFMTRIKMGSCGSKKFEPTVYGTKFATHELV